MRREKMACQNSIFMVHDHSEGAAETATRWWLEEQVPSMKENKLLIIVTGWGKNRQMWQTSDINDRVRNVLHDMEVQILPQDNPGRLLIQYRYMYNKA